MTHIARNKTEGIDWDNLGQRRPKFIALHRMWGTLKGTDSFFAPANSPHLTDYAIDVLDIDGKDLAGEIHKYNVPLGLGLGPGERALRRRQGLRQQVRRQRRQPGRHQH
jgi:hypothetical protein